MFFRLFVPVVVFVVSVAGEGADPLLSNCIQQTDALMTTLEKAFRLKYTNAIDEIFDDNAVVTFVGETYRGTRAIEDWFRMLSHEQNVRLFKFDRKLEGNPKTYDAKAWGWIVIQHGIFQYELRVIHDSSFRYYVHELDITLPRI